MLICQGTVTLKEAGKEPESTGPLSSIQRIGLSLLLVLILLFGAWVELRGALQHTRKTDIGAYLRAAWAVRTGRDIYSITDDRGLHYAYPPFLAVLMTPLADPPPDTNRAGYLPYAVTVGLWYMLTLTLGFWGAHILSNALEETSQNFLVRRQPRFCTRWWAVRTVPILILLPAIGRSQMRGQVGLLVAFVLCLAAASLIRGKKFRAGLWVAAAVSIKLIPIFLLLFPAWRRNWPMLFGIAVGLAISLSLIPIAAMGPDMAIKAYHSFYEDVIVLGLKGDTEKKLGKELTGITSTDSNSPMSVIHNIMYPSLARAARPKVAAPGVRTAHWLIAVLLTIITLIAAGCNKARNGRKKSSNAEETREALFFTSLIVLMFIISPVFHPHYISMIVPLVIIMISLLWDRYSYMKMPSEWKALFMLLIVSHFLTSIDFGFFFYLRDFGLVLLSTILLWVGAVFLLFKTRGIGGWMREVNSSGIKFPHTGEQAVDEPMCLSTRIEGEHHAG